MLPTISECNHSAAAETGRATGPAWRPGSARPPLLPTEASRFLIADVGLRMVAPWGHSLLGLGCKGDDTRSSSIRSSRPSLQSKQARLEDASLDVGDF